MASAISLEYLQSIQSQPGGLATLTPSGDTYPGTVPENQLPPNAKSPFKGSFADSANLETAYPTGSMADFAYVTADLAFYYWDDISASWVNQNITASAYAALSASEKSVVPWIIIPG